MQRFVNTIEQLNEAVRLISIGSVAHMRMALLLLDNAAEVLIARTARDELRHDETWGRIYKRAADVMPPAEHKKYVEEYGSRRVLTKKQRREVEMNFDAKVSYLVEHEHLDRGAADVLSGLHRHRNDTYHRDRMRVPILRATAILYLELCCELLVRLGMSGMYYSSNEDWSKFMADYGLTNKFFMMDRDSVDGLVARFRREVGIDGHELASALAEYLRSRIEVVEEQLDSLDYYENHDEALQSIQFAAAHGDAWYKKMAVQGPSALRAFEAAKAKFVAPVTSATLTEWKAAIEALSVSTAPKPDIFAGYHRLELKLEPIEEVVENEAAGYDAHIQMEIDHARGK